MAPKHRKNADHHGRRKVEAQPASLSLQSTGVQLDGSTLEGGGQLVRVALSLSKITGIPVHITNIRAGRGGGRSSGGLKESHLAALEVLAAESGAAVQGAHVGSKEVTFEPRARRPKLDSGARRTVELQKPGSVWLILQALLPWYLSRREGVELTLQGGTNVGSSMSGDYVRQVLLPVLENIGLPAVQVEVQQRGWAGSAPQLGEVRVSIPGEAAAEREARSRNGAEKASGAHGEMRAALPAFDVRDRGSISEIAITVVAHPAEMRTALVDQALAEVKAKFAGVEVEIAINEDSGDVRRLYLLLVAHTSNRWRLGRDYLGTGKALKNQKETDALVEGAVKTVVRELRADIEAGGCVDEYMQDQLVVFQALADGTSAVSSGEGRETGTLHTQTVRWVCEEMLGPLGFEVMNEGRCKGIGEGFSRHSDRILTRVNGGNGQ